MRRSPRNLKDWRKRCLHIVLDTVGNLETSQFWYPLGHGTWPEFLSDFREQRITGNTVFGSGGSGLFLPNNFSCTVSDNTLVGNRLGAMRLDGKNNNQGNTFTNNILVTSEGAYTYTIQAISVATGFTNLYRGVLQLWQ